jgi:branched-chain amino acid transport system permease protein
VVMLKAPKGIWGYVADRFGWQLLPLERRLTTTRQLPDSPT